MTKINCKACKDTGWSKQLKNTVCCCWRGFVVLRTLDSELNQWLENKERK